MRYKAALSDDEILLNYILTFGGTLADPEEVINLYGGVMPAIEDSYCDMRRALEMCGWSQSDFDDALAGMSLGERIYHLVPCAVISTRNIPDARQRARQAYIMLERLFRRKELPSLCEAIDEAVSDVSSDTGDGRRVTAEIMSLLKENGARDALRLRAARARARGIKRPTRSTCENTRDVDAAVKAVVRELFPNGLGALNALAVRVVSRRVSQICPDAGEEQVRLALDSLRAGHCGVSK